MKMIAAAMALLALAGCTTMQSTPYVNSSAGYAPTQGGRVDVVYSPPQRPYTSIGTVSAKKYKPGWSDPTVSDAIPQLREAAAQIGADGVIVRGSTPGNGTRMITVEGEAFRYTDVVNRSSNGGTSTPAAQTGRYTGDPEAAARSFASSLQCSQGIKRVSEIDGRIVFEGQCASGGNRFIECGGGVCKSLD